MKHLIVLIIVIFMLSGCSHNIPIANIEFTKIEKIKDRKKVKELYFNYYLYFSSDIELVNNLKENHLNARLQCYFKDKKIKESDFEEKEKDTIPKFELTNVGGLELIDSINNKLNYKVNIFFSRLNVETYSDKIGSLAEKMEVDAPLILKLLNAEPNCLSCAVTSPTYFSPIKRYISNTMCLPKSEMIKVMKN